MPPITKVVIASGVCSLLAGLTGCSTTTPAGQAQPNKTPTASTSPTPTPTTPTKPPKPEPSFTTVKGVGNWGYQDIWTQTNTALKSAYTMPRTTVNRLEATPNPQSFKDVLVADQTEVLKWLAANPGHFKGIAVAQSGTINRMDSQESIRIDVSLQTAGRTDETGLATTKTWELKYIMTFLSDGKSYRLQRIKDESRETRKALLAYYAKQLNATPSGSTSYDAA